MRLFGPFFLEISLCNAQTPALSTVYHSFPCKSRYSLLSPVGIRAARCLFWLSALVLLPGVGAPAAEIPQRFIAVGTWQGTFTKELSITGSGAAAGASGAVLNYNYQHHLHPGV